MRERNRGDQKLPKGTEERDGCLLVKFPLSIDDYVAIGTMLPKDAVIDTDVARLLGVDQIMGTAEDIERLRKASETEGRRRLSAELPDVLRNASAEAVEWYLSGRRGASSMTMFRTIVADVPEFRATGTAHPFDPADLDRCVALLDAVPEARAGLERMRAVSSTWNAMIDAWSELETLLAKEKEEAKDAESKPAPKTYAAMRALIDRQRR
jgi:hypothetical protein